MKNCYVIMLLAILLLVPLSHQYAHAYGGGGNGGVSNPGAGTGSDPANPPQGFKPTEKGSTIKKTTRSSTITWLDVGTRATQWVKSNPLKNLQNNFITRVPSGESCVEASKDRAAALAHHIKSLVDSGELDLGGHTVKVGSRSGYKVPLSGRLTGLKENIGTHTYTVIQIYDAKGNYQGGWEVDTYVTDMVLPHGQVNLEYEYPDHVKTITTPPKAKK